MALVPGAVLNQGVCRAVDTDSAPGCVKSVLLTEPVAGFTIWYSPRTEAAAARSKVNAAAARVATLRLPTTSFALSTSCPEAGIVAEVVRGVGTLPSSEIRVMENVA